MWPSNWSMAYPFTALPKLIARDNLWTKLKTPEIDLIYYLLRAICFVVYIRLLYDTINYNEFD